MNSLVDVRILPSDDSAHLRIARVGWHKAGPGEALGVLVLIEEEAAHV